MKGVGSGLTALGVRRPVLIAVPSGDARPSLEELHEHMSEHFAKWQLPDILSKVIGQRVLRRKIHSQLLIRFSVLHVSSV